MLLFLQVSLGARPDPSPIPSQALKLQVEEQLDWTLTNCTGLSVACTRQAFLGKPITPVILRKIYMEWEADANWDHSILWAYTCLCFFGFLKTEGAVIESDSDFDTSQHLSFANIISRLHFSTILYQREDKTIQGRPIYGWSRCDYRPYRREVMPYGSCSKLLGRTRATVLV